MPAAQPSISSACFALVSTVANAQADTNCPDGKFRDILVLYMLSFITQQEALSWNFLIFLLEKRHGECLNTEISVGTLVNTIAILCEMTVLQNCLWFWWRGLTQFVWTCEWRSVISSKQTFPFNVLTINPNSDCQCAWVKMPSSLLTAATAWRKLSLDIRGSQDKSGGLLACRHAEKKSDGPVKLSVASKVILIKDYYEKTWRYCQMSGLLWKYSPKMANRRQKGAQRSGWLADPPGGEGFISGAHNASVKGAPKVLLCIFVTED